MKRRYKAALLASVVILACTAIASADTEADVVTDLVAARTDAMSGFFAGELTREEALETLEEIETDLLKKEDMSNIDLYFRTDIEQVRGYSFEDVSVTLSDGEMICAKVTIKWNSEGLQGSEEFCHTYDVICIKEGNRYKLAQFY